MTTHIVAAVVNTFKANRGWIGPSSTHVNIEAQVKSYNWCMLRAINQLPEILYIKLMES